MTHDEFIIKLSAFYREPLTESLIDDKGNEVSVKNLRVLENLNWCKENISENYLDNFYNKILYNFKPTSINPYPIVSHLHEINNINQYPHPPRYKNESEKIVNLLENKSIGKNQTIDIENLIIKDLLEDVWQNDSNNDYVLEKYGTEVALKAWCLLRRYKNGEKIDMNQKISEITLFYTDVTKT